MTKREKDIQFAIRVIDGIMRQFKINITTKEGVPIILWDCIEHKAYGLIDKEEKYHE